jgi:hypothetical protein
VSRLMTKAARSRETRMSVLRGILYFVSYVI